MDLLTVNETALLLRVSPITIRRYIASGRLPAERVGRGIRVRREAIKDFITPVVSQSDSQEPSHWSHKPANYAEEDLVEIYSPSSPSGVVWVLIERLDEYLDEHVPIGDDPLRTIIGVGRSAEPSDVSEHKYEYLADAYSVSSSDEEEPDPSDETGKPFTKDDPLWDIVGIGRSDDPNDVARNKHKYLADAILSRKFGKE